MLGWLIGGYAVVSAVLGWRLVGVVVNCADADQRKDAIKMFGYTWGGGTVGTGLIAGAVRLHELGLLA